MAVDPSELKGRKIGRVLTKLGFACREVGQELESKPARLPIQVYEPTASAPVDRLVAVENGLATVHLAIAELQRRIEVLEAN